MSESFIIIPTWEKGSWTKTSFDTKEQFRDFVIPLFKEPGEYKFDDTTFAFNEQARIFNKNRLYCTAPKGSVDYKRYWDDQKDKCRVGAIYKSGNLTWYLPRDYYMWINFLKIFNKESQKYSFVDVRDAQYHMALYELLAELHHKHSSILKKRQIASSYYHTAKLINQLWFEEGVTLKIGASSKDHINEKNTWKFFVEYKNFLNEHTAWIRLFAPEKMHAWQQQIETQVGNRKVLKGLKGSLLGMTFDKDPTNGVGGPCRYFFHEEAGIAPKMNLTYEYIRPALSSGPFTTTGMFIAAGSVGDLDQCEPLKEFTYHPEANGIYAVESNLLDGKGTTGKTGLFIPEQWSMPPYIDEYGNSQIEKAILALDLQFEQWKKDLNPETYQLRISQHPRNINEAFAYRNISRFPQHLVSAQMRRIEDKEYPYELIDISFNAEGKVDIKDSNKIPISEFPLSRRAENKESVLVVWERPVKDPTFGMYYASIDPVGEGKTVTSESLCSIYVMKNAVEVTRIDGEKIENFVEKGKIVAAWCGRFDDINKTHQRLELIIEWYNAWTLLENNIPGFIQHMIGRKKQKYLVPKDQMMFFKDLKASSNVFQEYGWRNTGDLFDRNLLEYLVDFIKEELDHEVKEDGTVVRTLYGIERIPDPMALKEMVAYQKGLNVDRLVSLSALVAFSKIQQSNRGYQKRREDSGKKLEKSKDLFKLPRSLFVHMGGSNSFSKMKKVIMPFKNLS